MGLIQTNAWGATRASRDCSSLYDPLVPVGRHFRKREDEGNRSWRMSLGTPILGVVDYTFRELCAERGGAIPTHLMPYTIPEGPGTKSESPQITHWNQSFPPMVVTSENKTCFHAGKSGFCHGTAVLQMQVLKLCTDLDLSLLYILILGTYNKFAWKSNFLTLSV